LRHVLGVQIAQETAVQHSTPRRHPDGSIDFDYYRGRALALRRKSLRRTFRRVSLSTAGLVVVTALALAAVALSPARGTASASKPLEARAGIS
jgi:hypothetical protein